MDERDLLALSVDNELQEFKKLEHEIKERIEDLRAKRRLLNAQKDGGEMMTVWMMDSWSSADELSKREETLTKTKKEKNEIDLYIVDAYEKLSTLQLQKLSSIINKLKATNNKSSNPPCPLDCTVVSFNEWIKRNAQINIWQSEILESLAKKVRLTQANAEEEESQIMDKQSGLCSFDLKKKFEKLREKNFIEPQLIIDKKFSDYVHKLLDVNGFNFEAVKLREYIEQCNSDANHTGESFISPSSYQSFICALSQYILDRYGAENFPTSLDAAGRLDQTYAIVEGILFPQVEESIEVYLERQNEKDSMMEERYLKLKHLDQLDAGIKEKFITEGMFPHCKAITHIMQISLACTPSQKMQCILRAAHEIIQFMNSLCTQETVPGADEFMDIWVYVLLKARLPNFFFTVSLLRGYSNPRIGLSESGYYLASFELAGEYIRTLPDDFRLSTMCSDTDTKQCDEVYFMPEISRCRKFVEKSNSAFEIVQSSFRVNGFMLFADLDLQLETGRLFTSFLQENPTTHVLGALMRCKRKSNLKRSMRWIETQAKKLSDDLILKNVEGVLILFNPEDLSKVHVCPTNYEDNILPLSRRYVKISSGDYEQQERLLKRCLSLERLGCLKCSWNHLKTEVQDLSNDLNNVQNFLGNSHFLQLDNLDNAEDEDVDERIIQKVKDIQKRLLAHGCYSKLLPIDGIYGLATCHAVRLFQKRHHREHCFQEDTEFHIHGICDTC